MNKIIRHEWIQQDGFRVDECTHCHCIRKWDDGFKRIVYYTSEGSGPFFWAPSCKRVGMFADKVTKN